MHRHPIQTVKVFLPFFLICSYIFSDKTRVHLQFKAPENRKSGSISATAWHSARAWPRLSLYFSRPRDLFIFRSDLFKWFVHFHVIFTRVVLYIPWHAVVMIDSHICLITYWPQCHMGLFELTCAISGHDVKCTRYCSHVLDILLTWSHVKRTWLLFRRARRVLRIRPKRREVWWLSLVPEEGYFSPYRSPLLLSRCLAHAHDSPFSSTCNETLLSRWTFWSSFEKVPALALVQLKSFS